jgi:hypothetical protein
MCCQFQEANFQIHFLPNSEEFGKLVENPLQKKVNYLILKGFSQNPNHLGEIWSGVTRIFPDRANPQEMFLQINFWENQAEFGK